MRKKQKERIKHKYLVTIESKHLADKEDISKDIKMELNEIQRDLMAIMSVRKIYPSPTLENGTA